MKLIIDKVSIDDIDRRQALEIRNELLSIPEGCITFKKDKYPRLHELYQLLTATFESYKEGVHASEEDLGDFENTATDEEFRGVFPEGADSYIIFKSEQAKLADEITYDNHQRPIPLSNRFDPSNPDIRY